VKQVTTYVGIDAHKKDLFVAMLIGNEPRPVTWQLANEPTAVRRLVRKLEREAPGAVHVFYEAGPCGYALQRQLTTSRVQCDVVGPALIPRKPGERVKTNRRDARKLVELGRAGLLTAVQPPTLDDEAVRETWPGRGMMPAKTCNAVVIGWASCCCAAACTITVATGRGDIETGS
jgi:transposase